MKESKGIAYGRLWCKTIEEWVGINLGENGVELFLSEEAINEGKILNDQDGAKLTEVVTLSFS